MEGHFRESGVFDTGTSARYLQDVLTLAVERSAGSPKPNGDFGSGKECLTSVLSEVEVFVRPDNAATQVVLIYLVESAWSA